MLIYRYPMKIVCLYDNFSIRFGKQCFRSPFPSNLTFSLFCLSIYFSRVRYFIRINLSFSPGGRLSTTAPLTKKKKKKRKTKDLLCGTLVTAKRGVSTFNNYCFHFKTEANFKTIKANFSQKKKK